MKSGFVTILGKPNVGKSTLLNAIIGKKISIISPKSQTTRDSIQGIYNDSDSQIVFVDTPGILKPKNELDREMDKITFYNAKNNDLILYIVDSSRKFTEGDKELIKSFSFKCPIIVVFNKIDLTNVILINELKEIYKEYFQDAVFVELSALEEFNVDYLIEVIKEMLPEGPMYYETNTITNRSFTFMVQELIREKVLNLLEEEVPHSIAVICDEVNFRRGKNIYGKIIVEKDSQKGIVIGKQGRMIKKIGIQARRDIEAMLGFKINLELVVQVIPNWKNSSNFLAKIGYK